MDPNQQNLTDIEEQLRQLEEEISRKKAELEARRQVLLNTGGGAVIQGGVDITGGDFVNRDKHVHYHGEDSTTKAKQAEADYRRDVADRCGALPLRGVDATAGSATAETLSLAHVYISLDTRQTVPTQALAEALQAVAQGKTESVERFSLPTERENTQPLAALEATLLHRRLVLTGDPGSGKSTFINHLTHALACQDWTRLSDWPEWERQVLPIPVILRDFARWLSAQQPLPQACPGLLLDYLRWELHQRGLDQAAPVVEQALIQGHAMILLDGLDEVPPDNDVLLERIRDSVLTFADRYKPSRCLLTCRVLSYQEPRWQLPATTFPVFELAPFDTAKINQFIGAWYQEVGAKWHLPPGEPERLADKLRQGVRRRDLWRLAPNPLLLTVMALVHTHRRELPEQRALLYKDAVDILLLHWEHYKDVAAPQLNDLLDKVRRYVNDLKGILEQLAFEVQQGGSRQPDEQPSGIDEFTLLQRLVALHPKKDYGWAQRLLETLRQRSSLLLERKGQVFSFPHRTFQEYLAGVYLAHQPNFGEAAAKLAANVAFWREVILLAVGYLIHHRREQEKPRFLVDLLCPDRPPADESAWRQVWLAGEVLLEIGVNQVQDTEPGQWLLSRVQQRLATLLEQGMLTPRERAEAGEVLGQLGDPRFDPARFYLPCTYRGQPEPLAGFIEISPGPFVMGSRKGDTEDWGGESGNPATLTLDYCYWLARYPVTVAQFQCFIDAGGYEEPAWWTPAGWSWRQGQWDSQVEEDWLREHLQSRPVELRSAPMEWNVQRAYPNRPVVDVCWFEAMAYCCWLEAQMKAAQVPPLPDGCGIRLPTEAEWEKAARCGDDRRYPWGDEDWDETRANIDRCEIGHPTPVGLYPLGSTPTGLHDLSGNVWEWTLMLSDNYTLTWMTIRH
jgi:formylglycine-generating enzyme required for sulfatase activity